MLNNELFKRAKRAIINIDWDLNFEGSIEDLKNAAFVLSFDSIYCNPDCVHISVSRSKISILDQNYHGPKLLTSSEKDSTELIQLHELSELIFEEINKYLNSIYLQKKIVSLNIQEEIQKEVDQAKLLLDYFKTEGIYNKE